LSTVDTPQKLSRSEWLNGTKRAGSAFLADDCIGLAAADRLQLGARVLPGGRVSSSGCSASWVCTTSCSRSSIRFRRQASPHFIEALQKDTQGGASLTALVLGGGAAVWIASGAVGTVIKAVNRAYDRMETRPFWKTRLIAILLVLLGSATILVQAVLIVFGGPIGQAIADKAGLGAAFTLFLEHRPLADRVCHRAAAVRAHLLLLAERGPTALAVDHPPASFVGAVLWLALSGLFTVYVTFAGSYSKTLRDARRRRDPLAVAELLGMGRSSSAPS